MYEPGMELAGGDRIEEEKEQVTKMELARGELMKDENGMELAGGAGTNGRGEGTSNVNGCGRRGTN